MMLTKVRKIVNLYLFIFSYAFAFLWTISDIFGGVCLRCDLIIAVIYDQFRVIYFIEYFKKKKNKKVNITLSNFIKLDLI